MPAHRKLTLTDHEVLAALAAGESLAALSRRYGCQKEAARQRLQQIMANLPAPAARRSEEAVAQTLDAIAELHKNYALLGQVRDACLRLLASDKPGQIDLGAHDYDLEVLVSVGGRPPTRVPLKRLMDQAGAEDLISLESKHADPRNLLLSTIEKIRAHIELAVRLSERIHDAQSIAEFQAEVLHEIEQAAPEIATRIRSRLHERRTLRLALQPPGPR